MDIENQRSDRSLKLIYGEEVYNKIIQSNVLIGGAGGVGCEIIKSLSKTGFRKFTLIDLDTIELTNLNRQFYFRKHHVGKAKSACAKEGVLLIEPDILQVDAILGNIYDPKFDDLFYKQFDIAFCAFDNQGARRHFGKMCTVNNIPMVEAGTSAYNGQTQTRIKDLFECRNCIPEVKQQTTFNVCSIRTRPSEPIHCIVWASNMFNLIFGKQDDQNLLENYIQDIFKEGIKNIQDPRQKALQLFNKIFNEDIQNCDEKERFPISYEQSLLINNTEDAVYFDERNNRKLLEDEKIFTVKEYAQKFIQSFLDVFHHRKEVLGELKFDKDDQLALKFVAAITNLRTYNFISKNNEKNKLKYLSEHTIKQMAGNIIPAIASTNAIVSAIQVNEAIKIMKGYVQTKPQLFNEYLVQNGDNNKISPASLSLPQLSCPVCSPANCYINIKANCNQITFGQLKQVFEEQYLAYNQIIKIDDKVYYDPNQTSLRKVFENLLLKKVSELPNYNSVYTKFKLFSIDNQITWEFNLTHDSSLQGQQVVCDQNSDPVKIKQQQIQYIKQKHEQNSKEKIDVFKRYKYI
ncbi:hypothetical protein ABPG74_022383 [Tetrahymena malaccensis]